MKPTHTDQYLQWDSHHHISAKYSVTNTSIGSGQFVPHQNCSKQNNIKRSPYQVNIHHMYLDRMELNAELSQ